MKALVLFLVTITFSIFTNANPLSEQLAAKPSEERAEIFSVLMKQQAKACGEVGKTLLQGYTQDDDAYWSVACNNGSSYSVLISKEPVPPIVLSCSDKNLEVECFETFEK
ncbi:MAG: hypothetical protein AB8D52_10540 [Gammaproteobacteria bacterium]